MHLNCVKYGAYSVVIDLNDATAVSVSAFTF